MQTKLTIIIPFLNEGEEVEHTVESIKSTATTTPCIMLINDASTDAFDYEAAAQKHGCRYLHNVERLGVAASRNKGVKKCETPYFLLLDGHMRFYENGWDMRLVKLLEENPRSVLCGQTRRLEKDADGNVIQAGGKRISYGAYLSVAAIDGLKVIWNAVDITPYSTLSEVPCILGAAYACSKDYWEYLNGLNGLLYYGMDEQLISIKVWREGGRCLLVKNWEIGHIYRSQFPYEVPNKELIYNRLFILELLFPYSIKKDFFSHFKRVYGKEFEQALELMRSNYTTIKEQRDYLNSIFENWIDYFLVLNEKVADINGTKH
jgi:glycosyltransferase involved in cell wall biosynthesis